MELYVLPELPYGYKDLEPYISEEQLTIHHKKHHQAYVDASNALTEKLDKARKEKSELDMKSTLKALSFNVGGHVLHTLFWNNMKPANGVENKPNGELGEKIKQNFGSFERFKDEFTQTAVSVEGSGWAVLTDQLLIMQIEKHNVNIYPESKILLALDLWEHAYYLDYKNERAKFINNFWNIINWTEVQKRLS